MKGETRARMASPGGWGQVGADHARYSERKPDQRYGRRWCHWCEKAGRVRARATHVMMSNGVAMSDCCEWHGALWTRDGLVPLFRASAG